MPQHTRHPVPPRNHFTVPAPTKILCDTKPILHDALPAERAGKRLLNGAVHLRIQTLQSIHMGSGSFTLDDPSQPGDKSAVTKDVARLRGQAVIPGTGIKGVCRAVYELLTDSPAAANEESYSLGDSLSRAGSLFGTLGYQGRVSFDDAEPEGEAVLKRKLVSVAYKPQNAPLGTYRFYGKRPTGAVPPATLPVLVLPPGTWLSTRLRLRNVAEDELGGVLFALGVERFAPRLGGAKYDAIGMARFTVAGYRLHQGLAGPPDIATTAEDSRALIDRCLCAFEPTNNGKKALARLQKELPLLGKPGQ